jgi:hypothetical protein
VETDPRNHPAIQAANAGHQCAPEHPASLADPSESSVSPQEAGSRQIEALDYAGTQLDPPKHDDNLPEQKGILEEGL